MKECVSISAARVVLVSLRKILQSISRSWKTQVLLLRKYLREGLRTNPAVVMPEKATSVGIVAAAAAVHNSAVLIVWYSPIWMRENCLRGML